MSELFYYPSLQTTHHYAINGIEGDWAVSKEEWCDVMKINPETETKPPNITKERYPEVMIWMR